MKAACEVVFRLSQEGLFLEGSQRSDFNSLHLYVFSVKCDVQLPLLCWAFPADSRTRGMVREVLPKSDFQRQLMTTVDPMGLFWAFCAFSLELRFGYLSTDCRTECEALIARVPTKEVLWVCWCQGLWFHQCQRGDDWIQRCKAAVMFQQEKWGIRYLSVCFVVYN